MNKELIEKAKMLKELKVMSDELTAEISGLEDSLKALMGDEEIVYAGDYKLTYKTVKSSRFDSKGLKAELPEIAARYTIPTEYKRFCIM